MTTADGHQRRLCLQNLVYDFLNRVKLVFLLATYFYVMILNVMRKIADMYLEMLLEEWFVLTFKSLNLC